MKHLVRMASPDEVKTMKFRDYSAVTAMYMCPTWGAVRYGMQRKVKGMNREMALDAGHAMHDVFAATRVWNLMVKQQLFDHGVQAMIRMWGNDKMLDMLAIFNQERSDKFGEYHRAEFVLHALFTSGFYDSPYDKRRTLDNMETATHFYLQMADKHNPVWVANINDPFAPIGIEQPFHCIVETMGRWGKTYGLYGKIDGIEMNKKGIPKLAENKTTWRIDDAFRCSFDTSHQITGYMAAARALYGIDLVDANVYAMTIPLTKSHVDSYARVPVKRTAENHDEWAQWFVEGHKMYDKYAGIRRVQKAPKYTHSCSRFFRACSMIPLCSTPKAEWKDFFKETMVEHKWDPTAEQEEVSSS